MVTSNVPPFATREPERFQAVRIVTFNESSPGGPTTERSSRVSIARDGEKRREEYFIGSSESIVYLEIPAGRFVLLPLSGIYADMKAVDNEAQVDLMDETALPSADLLINEGFSASTYEKVGTESLDRRMTTKYRVMSSAASQAGGNFETLIWIDESLGLPVRSESTSAAGERSSKTTMELKNITLEVDEDLFTLPANYRRVDGRLVLEKIRESRSRMSSSVGKE
ncbi:MAG: hypothetical protein ACREBC_13685 [Pyrinomonadaceae bacterium]